MGQQCRVYAGLFRDQAEAAEGGCLVFVNPQFAAGFYPIALNPQAPFHVFLRWSSGEIHKQDATEVFAVIVAGFQCSKAAKTVADNNRALAQFSSLADRPDLICKVFTRVLLPPVTVAVAGQVDGGDPKTVSQKWRGKAPPFKMGVAAVDQHNAGVTDIAPGFKDDVCAIDQDIAGLGGDFKGLVKPEG